MKGGVYILLGLVLLFVALYIFAYVMTKMDKRKIKKGLNKTSKNQIFYSSNMSMSKKPLEYSKQKRYSNKRSEMQD